MLNYYIITKDDELFEVEAYTNGIDKEDDETFDEYLQFVKTKDRLIKNVNRWLHTYVEIYFKTKENKLINFKDVREFLVDE